MRAEGMISPELERLLGERVLIEQRSLRIQFALCFAGSLFALAAMSLIWGGLKRRKRAKAKRNREPRADSAPRSPRYESRRFSRASTSSSEGVEIVSQHEGRRDLALDFHFDDEEQPVAGSFGQFDVGPNNDLSGDRASPSQAHELPYHGQWFGMPGFDGDDPFDSQTENNPDRESERNGSEGRAQGPVELSAPARVAPPRTAPASRVDRASSRGSDISQSTTRVGRTSSRESDRENSRALQSTVTGAVQVTSQRILSSGDVDGAQASASAPGGRTVSSDDALPTTPHTPGPVVSTGAGRFSDGGNRAARIGLILGVNQREPDGSGRGPFSSSVPNLSGPGGPQGCRNRSLDNRPRAVSVAQPGSSNRTAMARGLPGNAISPSSDAQQRERPHSFSASFSERPRAASGVATPRRASSAAKKEKPKHTVRCSGARFYAYILEKQGKSLPGLSQSRDEPLLAGPAASRQATSGGAATGRTTSGDRQSARGGERLSGSNPRTPVTPVHRMDSAPELYTSSRLEMEARNRQATSGGAAIGRTTSGDRQSARGGERLSGSNSRTPVRRMDSAPELGVTEISSEEGLQRLEEEARNRQATSGGAATGRTTSGDRQSARGGERLSGSNPRTPVTPVHRMDSAPELSTPVGVTKISSEEGLQRLEEEARKLARASRKSNSDSDVHNA